uniref:LSM domain-containing protein n=1 Tax=Fundulus heteroclitus TaxID=8078 RepID=A0A3Q2P3L2_FUNHE
MLTGSPLGELHRCVEARIRVRVHIRTFKGLRGVCSGFVVAFDKFWNMVSTGPRCVRSNRWPWLTWTRPKSLPLFQLFEKLSLQDSSGRGDPVEKRDARDKPSEGQADDPKSTGTREDSRRAGPGLSEKGGVSGKERDPAANQKTYGKVRSRHINQLFVRGENVILVNPQPL